MLQHDYLMEIIQQFARAVSSALRRALAQKDEAAAQEVEAAVGELLQLDPQTAMSLAPGSLVTMMQLAGTGDAVSGYVAFSLNKLADAYDGMGQQDVAQQRRAQAQAVADAFGASLDEVPEELRDLDLG
ncbi:MAG: hypothetical protein ACI360_06485 [Atopobiaceae bacterium]